MSQDLAILEAELIDLQIGLVPGSTRNLGEMELSVMGEMGNITGSFFLNALADATNLTLAPSPPAVMVDMAGAILDIALAEIMKDQEFTDLKNAEWTVFKLRWQEQTGQVLDL